AEIDIINEGISISPTADSSRAGAIETVNSAAVGEGADIGHVGDGIIAVNGKALGAGSAGGTGNRGRVNDEDRFLGRSGHPAEKSDPMVSRRRKLAGTERNVSVEE